MQNNSPPQRQPTRKRERERGETGKKARSGGESRNGGTKAAGSQRSINTPASVPSEGLCQHTSNNKRHTHSIIYHESPKNGQCSSGAMEAHCPPTQVRKKHPLRQAKAAGSSPVWSVSLCTTHKIVLLIFYHFFSRDYSFLAFQAAESRWPIGGRYVLLLLSPHLAIAS